MVEPCCLMLTVGGSRFVDRDMAKCCSYVEKMHEGSGLGLNKRLSGMKHIGNEAAYDKSI